MGKYTPKVTGALTNRKYKNSEETVRANDSKKTQAHCLHLRMEHQCSTSNSQTGPYHHCYLSKSVRIARRVSKQNINC